MGGIDVTTNHDHCKEMFKQILESRKSTTKPHVYATAAKITRSSSKKPPSGHWLACRVRKDVRDDR